ncbi:unnamed protein product [Heterotrigona itama]|uniref:Uncharacterized protein n=1 Tax=Heterotrigona itama TaxID=395501 RepID=A0A6V7HG48_9HYME|nr:unnamed protein product [Heterotrigona itama]
MLKIQEIKSFDINILEKKKKKKKKKRNEEERLKSDCKSAAAIADSLTNDDGIRFRLAKRDENVDERRPDEGSPFTFVLLLGNNGDLTQTSVPTVLILRR